MRAAAVGTLTALLACGHSEPFTTADQRNDGPFSPVVPVRLTYSPQSDLEPAFSADGRWVLYVAERPVDQDRCVNVVPVGGGTWTHHLCAWELDQASRKDGLANAAARGDGVLLFTRHSGAVGTLTSPDKGVYLVRIDSLAAARQILPLGTRPAGGTASWDDLIDPIWTGADELLTLAARRHVYTDKCPQAGCPRDADRVPRADTIRIGIELARLRITDGQATVLDVIPAVNATAWSHDPSTNVVHLVVRTPYPDDVDGHFEALADTIHRVSLADGHRVAILGATFDGPMSWTRLHGVASGHGRVFVSRSWREPHQVAGGFIPPVAALLHSDIIEILPTGGIRVVAEALSWRWGRIRLSPDGRHLLAEAIERTTSDIYLLDLQP